MFKTYNVQQNIGKAKYVITYYTGQFTHKDGSLAPDILIFQNKTKLKKAINWLIGLGYQAK